MMPTESKKPGIWTRVFSRFNNRRSKSYVQREDSSSSSLPARASSFRRSSTRSVLTLPLPADNQILPTHGSQIPIYRLRSDAEVHSSHSLASPMTGDPDLLQPKGGGATTSFFRGASGVHMGDIQYFEASQITVHSGGDATNDGWELLLKNIAPNALHDSSARYDAPKCDEDTRVEVTHEIMDWIQNLDGPQRLLCMTGAAGSGKSALLQTIAERCTPSGILSAAFFCSSEDPTRNTVSSIVPTIAYQIGLKHYAFRSAVAAAVKHDPNIFSRSLQSQMDVLIVHPFEGLRRSQRLDTNTFPYVILIDGLDECISASSTTLHPVPADADDRHQAEDRQAELLVAIRHSILSNNLPFRVFIASRPEWAIRTALGPGGHLRKLAYHIALSDKYDAFGDMCRYLRRRFEDIGIQIGDPQWFSEDTIETLVQAASGQFVYVATVYKYISERRSSPVERLKVILAWTPHKGQVARPFEALDRLYASILLTAKNAYEAVDTHHGRDFLLLLRAYHMNIAPLGFVTRLTNLSFTMTADLLTVLLGLEARAEEILVSDLRSLVTLDKDGSHLNLRLYHKSFSDFLSNKSRAKELFVPKSRVYTHLTKCCMKQITGCPLDFDSLPDKWEELSIPKQQKRCLQEAVEALPYLLTEGIALDDEIANFTRQNGWLKHKKLLLLLLADREELVNYWESFVKNLRHITDNLAARKPEVAAAITEFLDTLERDLEPVES